MTRRIRFYNYRGRRVQVTVRLFRAHVFWWTWIVGVQIGEFFFGCIRGRSAEHPDDLDARLPAAGGIPAPHPEVQEKKDDQDARVDGT